MLGGLGSQWPTWDLRKKLSESLAGDSPSPEVPAKPIPDLPLIVGSEADEVARDVVIDEDRSKNDGRVAHDPQPVRLERRTVAHGHRRHASGVLIQLMLEEDPEVVRVHRSKRWHGLTVALVSGSSATGTELLENWPTVRSQERR